MRVVLAYKFGRPRGSRTIEIVGVTLGSTQGRLARAALFSLSFFVISARHMLRISPSGWRRQGPQKRERATRRPPLE